MKNEDLMTLNDNKELVVMSSIDVRMGQGIQIQLFRELLIALAQLAVANPNHAILLRGQNRDVRDHEGTVIQPKAFRPDADDLTVTEAKLRTAQELLCSEVQLLGFPKSVIEALETPLIAQALMQHYEIAATPWLDLTDLPNLAVSFACQNTRHPHVYAFAIPRQGISYAPQKSGPGLMCWALSSLCPAYALRPHFQRAFVLADIDLNQSDAFPEVSAFSKDLSHHLLCKFQLTCNMVLPELHQFGCPQGHAIYPAEYADPMLGVCNSVKEQLRKKYP